MAHLQKMMLDESSIVITFRMLSSDHRSTAVCLNSAALASRADFRSLR